MPRVGHDHTLPNGIEPRPWPVLPSRVRTRISVSSIVTRSRATPPNLIGVRYLKSWNENRTSSMRTSVGFTAPLPGSKDGDHLAFIHVVEQPHRAQARRQHEPQPARLGLLVG